MGTPPDEDGPDEPGSKQEDPDRSAILARRQRFIALALSGLATAGCDKPSDDSKAPRNEPAQEGKDDGEARPQPCLMVVAPEDGANDSSATPRPDDEIPQVPPNACLKIAMPPEEPTEPVEPAKPQPCLKVAAPDDEPEEPTAKPRPCLKVAAPKDDPEPAKPRPCLRVAKPD